MGFFFLLFLPFTRPYQEIFAKQEFLGQNVKEELGQTQGDMLQQAGMS